MANDWGDVMSCLIIAEPTFPPGYYLISFSQLDRQTYLGNLKNKMMIGAYQISYSNHCYVL